MEGGRLRQAGAVGLTTALLLCALFGAGWGMRAAAERRAMLTVCAVLDDQPALRQEALGRMQQAPTQEAEALLAQEGYEQYVQASSWASEWSAAGRYAAFALAGLLAAQAWRLGWGWRCRRQWQRLVAEAETLAEGRPVDWSEQSVELFSRLEQPLMEIEQRFQGLAEELTQERRQHQEFVTNISHQLKTPLTTVRLFHEMELRQDQTAERRTRLERSLSQVERMDRLIHSLLSLARLESGLQPMQMERHDLGETVQKCVATAQTSFGQKQVTVNVQLPGAVHLRYDEHWMGEALENLLVNAWRHTPQGGQIDVVVEDLSALATVTVTDSGPGIDARDLPHVFERFYQSPYRPPSGGVGIGLALAQAIAGRHHGTLRAGNAPAGGARFVLTLPRLPLQVAAESPSLTKSSPTGSRG